VRVITAVLIAGVLGFAIAGCGHTVGTTSQSAPAATHKASPAISSPKATPADTAALNERAFADGLASANSLIPNSVIAGPVMRAYQASQYEIVATAAASGNPPGAETVTPISDGYQLCSAGNGSGQQCDELTQFVTDAAGRITGVSVNGVPVGGRLATGPASHMAGLVVSGVVAYLSLDLGDKAVVAFEVRDLSYKPINSSPACLATLATSAGTYSADSFHSALPSTLTPGETAYGYAFFDTTQITGTFSLHSNDGYNLLLASSTLSKVG
jgi:hypothetical protein